MLYIDLELVYSSFLCGILVDRSKVGVAARVGETCIRRQSEPMHVSGSVELRSLTDYVPTTSGSNID